MAKEAKDRMDEEGQEGESPAPSKKGGKKTVLIIAAVASLVLLIGVPVLILSLKGKTDTHEAASDAATQVHEPAAPEGADDEDQLDEQEEALGAIFPLETFVVNLAQGGYIKLQLQLEFEDREVPRRFFGMLVPVRDAVIMLLSQRTAGDLKPANGKETLRTNIKELVNELLRRELVKRVYFTQFVIQEQ